MIYNDIKIDWITIEIDTFTSGSSSSIGCDLCCRKPKPLKPYDEAPCEDKAPCATSSSL